MPAVGKIKKFFSAVYENVVSADGSPHRVAAGFGLGVFLGILPGTGPIAALVLAELLRVNRAAALSGCLLTNSWLSVATFILAAKLGAMLTSTSWRTVHDQGELLLKHFHWKNLFEVSFLKIIFPLLAGYVCVGLLLGLMAYLTVMVVLLQRKKRQGQKNDGARGLDVLSQGRER